MPGECVELRAASEVCVFGNRENMLHRPQTTSVARRDRFRTATGHLVLLDRPDPADVCPQDIALSLARQCRFAGHIRADLEHYSIAQHSVLVSHACTPAHALIGLLHDAAEAYVQDLVRPLRAELGERYAELERGWALAIGIAFDLGDALVHLPADVRAADDALLATEARDVLAQDGEPWTFRASPLPEVIAPLRAFDARRLFLERLTQLVQEAA